MDEITLTKDEVRIALAWYYYIKLTNGHLTGLDGDGSLELASKLQKLLF